MLWWDHKKIKFNCRNHAFFFFLCIKKLLECSLIRHKHKLSNYVSQRAVKRTKKNCCSQFTFKRLMAFLLSQCFVYCVSCHYIKATVKCRLFCLQVLCVSGFFSHLAVWAALFNSVYSLGTDNADGESEASVLLPQGRSEVQHKDGFLPSTCSM